ncbi:hypothetical protein [Streptosporangium sp. KLBMP 9127]|nr:hypothetical protein [Streptosporangium sp. KLBMP 9127]
MAKRLRRAVRAWFDARYIPRAEHRDAVRDILWEVQAAGRELAELRREVETMRARLAKPVTAPVTAPVKVPDPRQTARWDDAHRLASETASAVDHLLQNEILLWQAVDRIDLEGAT